MNAIINRLIRLNIKLEGVLRVAAERPEAAEAVDEARQIFNEMQGLLASIEPVRDDKTLTVIKDGEATAAESAPVAEPSQSRVPDAVVVESDNDAVAVAEEAAPEPAPTPEPAPARASAPAQAFDLDTARMDICKAFTINDKFLFRRELFGGNDAEMTDTIDLLASMHSLAEAEEYLYDDLQWDRENDTVRDFMAIIANYFNIR